MSGPAPEDRAWAAQRKADVVGAAEAFVARHAVDAAQRTLLERALRSLRARRAEPLLTPSVHLPLLVFGAIAGDESPALPLAAATALLELGVDLLDHIADGELDPAWAEVPAALAQLAATGFLSAIPQLALAELDAPAETVALLQRSLAEGLFAIGAGQQRDLASTLGDAPALDEVERAAFGKTGERRALYARLAAQLAGAAPEVADGFARMGRRFGVALQWASDLADVASADGGRDLAAGTPTLPVVLWLGLQDDREAARALLRTARCDAGAREELRAVVASGAVMRGCLLKIAAEREQARRALDGLPCREPFARRLAQWLDESW